MAEREAERYVPPVELIRSFGIESLIAIGLIKLRAYDVLRAFIDFLEEREKRMEKK